MKMSIDTYIRVHMLKEHYSVTYEKWKITLKECYQCNIWWELFDKWFGCSFLFGPKVVTVYKEQFVMFMIWWPLAIHYWALNLTFLSKFFRSLALENEAIRARYVLIFVRQTKEINFKKINQEYRTKGKGTKFNLSGHFNSKL